MRIILFFLFSTFCFAQTKNPYAPNSPWPEGHGIYCQQSTDEASVESLESLKLDRIPFGSANDGWSPSGTIVSERYENGAYSCWGTNAKKIYKVIVQNENTKVIFADKTKLGHKLVSGYWVMTKDKHCYFMSDWTIYILKDSDIKDPYSEIELVAKIPTPELKTKGPGLDFMIGMKLLYNGQIVITTRKGKIALFDPIERKIVQIIELGEKIQNNMAVEEGNFVYLNSNRGTYQFQVDKNQIKQGWFTKTVKSGSTLTLLNAGDDKLLVVTNESNPLVLFALWRHEIPKEWTSLPGKVRRIAGEIQIDYGKNKPKPSKNSVLVHENKVVIANWTGLWPYAKKDNPGLSKYFWDSQANHFKNDWINTEIALPNSMQALSTKTGLMYAVGRRKISGEGRIWTFEAIDWQTGKSAFYLPLGSDKMNNATGSGIQIGWNGDILFMTPKAAFRLYPRSVPTN
ncbi:MAG: hypothetical protein AAGA43_10845 [Bacteroidota bacterium]